jgi:hypothetical protein
MENATGSNYNDTLRGNKLGNVLKGGRGNDTINGREGGDTIQGGPGSNKLDGGPGADTYLFTSRTDFRIVSQGMTAAALAALPPPTLSRCPPATRFCSPQTPTARFPATSWSPCPTIMARRRRTWVRFRFSAPRA